MQGIGYVSNRSHEILGWKKARRPCLCSSAYSYGTWGELPLLPVVYVALAAVN